MKTIQQEVLDIQNIIIEKMSIIVKDDIKYFQETARNHANLQEYSRGRIEEARCFLAILKDI